MTARLPAGTIVSALIRRVNDAGGFATVLARGDPHGGAILLVCRSRDGAITLLERGVGVSGAPALIGAGSPDPDPESLDSYVARRRKNDPDLWVIELDSPDAERFAAETMALD